MFNGRRAKSDAVSAPKIVLRSIVLVMTSRSSADVKSCWTT